MNFEKINQATLKAWEHCAQRYKPNAGIGTVKQTDDCTYIGVLPDGGRALYFVPKKLFPFDIQALCARLSPVDSLQRLLDQHTPPNAETEPATLSGRSKDNGKLVEIKGETLAEWFDKKLLSVFNPKEVTFELATTRGSKYATLIVRDAVGVVGMICPVAKPNTEGRA